MKDSTVLMASTPTQPRLRAGHFLAVMCGVALVQSAMVTGVMSSVITTIEKRYGFRSSQAGALFSVYDVAALVTVVPASHYGALWHIPKSLSVSMLILGLGCFVGALPQLISGKYRVAGADDEPFLCAHPGTEPECFAANNAMFGIFVVAQALIGTGASTIFTLGPTYLAEAADPVLYPVFIGIFFGFAAVGPALGYVGSGQALNIYVDSGTETQLTPDDAQWVGSWWMPFVVCGAFAWIMSGILCIFPRRMEHSSSVVVPSPIAMMPRLTTSSDRTFVEAKIPEQQRLSRTSPTLTHTPTPLNHSLWSGLGRVMRNKVFVWISLAQSSEMFAVSAYAAFLAKFMQTQFRLTSSLAAIATGLVVIPGAAGGIMLGGYLTKRLKLDFAATAKFCVICSFIATLFTACTLVGCKESPLAGVNYAYDSGSDSNSLDAVCNQDCGCEAVGYDPVCGVNNVNYFNPCFAGCATAIENATKSGTLIFENCSCVGGQVGDSEVTIQGVVLRTFEAYRGTCVYHDGCGVRIAGFLVGLFLLMLFTFLNHAPSIVILVETTGEDSALGLSVNTQWYRLLGAIPSPVAFGAVLDLACRLKDRQCGKESCEIYSALDMRLMFFVLGFAFKTFSTLFFAMTWRECKRSPPLQHRNVTIEVL